MVRDRFTHLTKLGFRRDIKLFLAALVGFLVVLILSLLLVLQTTLLELQRNQWNSWELVADLATKELSALPAQSPAELESRLTYVRSRYPVAAISLRTRAGAPVVSGTLSTDGRETLVRQTPAGTVRFEFDALSLNVARRRFYATAAIVFFSTVLSSQDRAAYRAVAR